jgi:type I restriction enzyme, S subunit
VTDRATESLLGPVPVMWQVAPLRVAGEFFGGGTPDTGNPSLWDGDIPWLSSQDVRGRWVRATTRAITSKGLSGSSARMARRGDMVFVMRSGILRHTLPSSIVGTDMAINQDIKALRLRGPWIAEYLSYVVTGPPGALLARWRSEGATVESLDLDLMRRTVLPVPPGREQRSIAEFLDRETERIDALVAKKQRLIELLQEKRTALITTPSPRASTPMRR